MVSSVEEIAAAMLVPRERAGRRAARRNLCRCTAACERGSERYRVVTGIAPTAAAAFSVTCGSCDTGR